MSVDDGPVDELDDFSDVDVVQYEYKLNPNKTSLELIRSVQDFTDREKILSSAFMSVPKQEYHSEFVPRHQCPKIAPVSAIAKSSNHAAPTC